VEATESWSSPGHQNGLPSANYAGGSQARSSTSRPAVSRRAGALARPKVAVDVAVFAVAARRLRCYLVQLKKGPLSGKWAFPGGLVRVGEELDHAARRELSSTVGLRDCYLEQLFTFGDPRRDPRAHVVSVAYMALVATPAAVAEPAKKYRSGRWFAVSKLPPLAYDHREVARYAIRRLKSKLAYTNIACNLLPRTFTFAALEELYTALLGRPIDRRNFRRRIMAMGLLRRLDMMRRGPHRPAALYRFARLSPQVVEML
jgi:8-oxo-dGTP diphosphatase